MQDKGIDFGRFRVVRGEFHGGSLEFFTSWRLRSEPPHTVHNIRCCFDYLGK